MLSPTISGENAWALRGHMARKRLHTVVVFQLKGGSLYEQILSYTCTSYRKSEADTT